MNVLKIRTELNEINLILDNLARLPNTCRQFKIGSLSDCHIRLQAIKRAWDRLDKCLQATVQAQLCTTTERFLAQSLALDEKGLVTA